jgi:NAD(P)-dependent dehydrogenase (short-subunit alcohol dehydrogenase family)
MAGKLFVDIVTWLAGDEARWVTGQNVRANGGLI